MRVCVDLFKLLWTCVVSWSRVNANRIQSFSLNCLLSPIIYMFPYWLVTLSKCFRNDQLVAHFHLVPSIDEGNQKTLLMTCRCWGGDWRQCSEIQSERATILKHTICWRPTLVCIFKSRLDFFFFFYKSCVFSCLKCLAGCQYETGMDINNWTQVFSFFVYWVIHYLGVEPGVMEKNTDLGG